MSTVSGKSAKRRANEVVNRFRDADGEIRRKRGDTLVGTLRQEYGDDFAVGFRSDARLATVLEETDSDSLSDYLRRRPAPGRPATARDTAKILGVSETRAGRLICEAGLDNRCRAENGQIRRKRSSVGAVAARKKAISAHATSKVTTTRTDRSEAQS